MQMEEAPNSPATEEELDLVRRITGQLKEVIETEDRKAVQSTRRGTDQDLDQLAEKAAKKARLEIPEFKKKGTKEQLMHSKDVLDEMNSALAALEKNDVQLAKEKLEQGKTLVKKRLKAIKIADREEHGWAVVRHYESDALASDTDDEKDLGRARRAAAAEAKRGKEKTKAKALARRRYTNRPYHDRPGQGSSGSFTRADPKRGTKPVCFSCGKEGHMQSSCFSRLRK